MIVTTHTEPFEYHTLQQVLPQELFDKLRQKAQGWPKAVDPASRVNTFIMDAEHTKQQPEDIVDLEMHTVIRKALADTIQDNFDIVLDDYDVNLEFISATEGFNFKVHADGVSKVATLVLYISDEGDGTVIHDNDHNEVVEAPWEPNGGIFFFRTDNSWHSYRSTVQSRETLNFIISKRGV